MAYAALCSAAVGFVYYARCHVCYGDAFAIVEIVRSGCVVAVDHLLVLVVAGVSDVVNGS